MKKKISIHDEQPATRRGRPPVYPFAEMLKGKTVRCIGSKPERARFVAAAKSYLFSRDLRLKMKTRGDTVNVWSGGPKDV